eukprot:CAMPEP_0179083912 /NCGR_PEP_ID=MMETSP0796-20121207/37918_1 /TAXON_ID=73915 /ORGANISM="Pyrodinium bahamense, Strain pbaha01" /LENGTH=217 /DNA_ID=CAMNT_0020781325 /DNA_START=148 /DNA_END=799 /DNA_ORIENTATION=-
MPAALSVHVSVVACAMRLRLVAVPCQHSPGCKLDLLSLHFEGQVQWAKAAGGGSGQLSQGWLAHGEAQRGHAFGASLRGAAQRGRAPHAGVRGGRVCCACAAVRREPGASHTRAAGARGTAWRGGRGGLGRAGAPAERAEEEALHPPHPRCRAVQELPSAKRWLPGPACKDTGHGRTGVAAFPATRRRARGIRARCAPMTESLCQGGRLRPQAVRLL